MNQLDLKSPIFKPKPGWGGKLNMWLKNNFESRILPTLAIIIFLAGAYMYLVRKNVAQVPLKEETQINSIEKIVQPGQGLTHVARSVIADYLNKTGLNLSVEQKLFAETYLVKLAGQKNIKAGETISFSTEFLSQSIEKALTLDEHQIKSWSQYIK